MEIKCLYFNNHDLFIFKQNIQFLVHINLLTVPNLHVCCACLTLPLQNSIIKYKIVSIFMSSLVTDAISLGHPAILFNTSIS